MNERYEEMKKMASGCKRNKILFCNWGIVKINDLLGMEVPGVPTCKVRFITEVFCRPASQSSNGVDSVPRDTSRPRTGSQRRVSPSSDSSFNRSQEKKEKRKKEGRQETLSLSIYLSAVAHRYAVMITSSLQFAHLVHQRLFLTITCTIMKSLVMPSRSLIHFDLRWLFGCRNTPFFRFNVLHFYPPPHFFLDLFSSFQGGTMKDTSKEVGLEEAGSAKVGNFYPPVPRNKKVGAETQWK